MKNLRLLVILIVFLTLPSLLMAQETDVAADTADSTEVAQVDDATASLAEGDALYKTWDHQAALDVYLAADKIYPDNYDLTWRIARQYTELGQEVSNKEKTEKESTYQTAMDFARKAVELNPDGVDGHLRVAIAAGRLGLFKGGKELINLSKDVKGHADKAVELDPNNHIGHYLLGRWNRKIANLGFMKKTIVKIVYGGFPPASNETCVEQFKKTIELKPDFVEAHLELGRTYAKRMKMYAEARAEYQEVLDLPNIEEDDAKFKAEAKELMDKIKNKK